MKGEYLRTGKRVEMASEQHNQHHIRLMGQAKESKTSRKHGWLQKWKHFRYKKRERLCSHHHISIPNPRIQASLFTLNPH